MARKSRSRKQISTTNLAIVLVIAVIAIILLFGGTSTAKFYAANKQATAVPAKQTKQIPLSQQVKTQCMPAQEVCDGKDNDCNGKVDDGLAKYNYYNDRDKDTYGDAIAPAFVVTCYNEPQAGQSVTTDDCDDTNAVIHPNAQETCGDGKDNNCNGQADENCAQEICDGTDNDGNGIVDDGAVCNSASNCGAFGNDCSAIGKTCVYNSAENKYYCQENSPSGGGGY